MAESEEKVCVSFFFQNDTNKTTAVSPNRIFPAENLDCSQDSSHAIDNINQNQVQPSLSSLSQHSQLTIEEQEPIKVAPLYNITPRYMPLSPHRLIEEEVKHNPWALLVVTIFLTKTSGKTARPYIKKFFEEYPTPYHVLNDQPTSLERYFHHLGLRKRGVSIWKMTYQFVSSKWWRASDLHGIGQYGEDAYRIFILGHTDFEPGDRYLKLYLGWLRQTDFMEDWAVKNGECFIDYPELKYYIQKRVKGRKRSRLEAS